MSAISEETTVPPQVLLGHHLKSLKLPTFAREYEKVAAECVRAQVDYPRYLLRLCELERIDRDRRNMERRIRQARFPQTKSLDTFDFKAIPSLNKSLVLELARGEWIERRENCIALGPVGTGKTHTALALGLAACQKNYSVLFVTAAALVHELMEARDERRLRALLDRLTHHVPILEMNGESYRLAASKKRARKASEMAPQNPTHHGHSRVEKEATDNE
jgi:DNA replication protein DnaC